MRAITLPALNEDKLWEWGRNAMIGVIGFLALREMGLIDKDRNRGHDHETRIRVLEDARMVHATRISDAEEKTEEVAQRQHDFDNEMQAVFLGFEIANIKLPEPRKKLRERYHRGLRPRLDGRDHPPGPRLDPSLEKDV